MLFWQSDQEVEEQIAIGRTKLWQRKGATDAELKYAALDETWACWHPTLSCTSLFFPLAQRSSKQEKTRYRARPMPRRGQGWYPALIAFEQPSRSSALRPLPSDPRRNDTQSK
jgi:hypothetical protein